MTGIDEEGGTGTAFQGALLAILSTLAVAAALLIAPVLPRMLAAFAGDPAAETKVVLALTIPALVVTITAPFIGRLIERVGRKPVLLAALAIYFFCGIAPYFLASLDHIIFSRIGVGLGEAGVMTTSTTLIGDYFKGSRREYWLVIQTGIASLASVLFGFASGLLGEWGWRAPFLVYGMALIYIPLVLFLIREPRRARAATTIRPATQPFPWASVWRFYAIGFPAALIFFIVPIQTPFLLTGRGLDSPTLIGLTAAVSGTAVTAGGFLFKAISKVALEHVLALAFSLVAIGMGLFIGDGSYFMTLGGVIVASIGCGITLPAILTALMANLSFEDRGRGTGGWQTAFFLGNFLSPLAILALSAGLRGLENALLVIAALAACLSLLNIAIGRRTGGFTPRSATR
ncbi:MFS transporter [Sphingobium sp. LB126]|uniref:MFS transporter n=1 Tax=Sphingobium sp. LB126 TaxID=1983755 RepID=UPI000C204191|nr:MFS transporter [Sphingobium sp. LB126]PJG46225.1 MFS transporter [Sphingobium sp. LB126]